jgi:hypothetical protein
MGRCGLTAEQQGRLAVLERRAKQGAHTPQDTAEYFRLQLMRLAGNLMSFGQRCLVPAPDETERAELEADRARLQEFYAERWTTLTECHAAGQTVAPEDWQLTQLGRQITSGTWTQATFDALAQLCVKLAADLAAARSEAALVAPEIEPVSAATKEWRKRRLHTYYTQHDYTAQSLARRLGMDVSALRAIVREDRTKFSDDKQKALLEALDLSVQEWYAKR